MGSKRKSKKKENGTVNIPNKKDKLPPGMYDSDIISDIPKMIEDDNISEGNLNQTSGESSSSESSHDFQTTADIKYDDLSNNPPKEVHNKELSQNGSYKNQKCVTKKEGEEKEEKEGEELSQRMIHTKILEKDNPFIEENGKRNVHKETINTVPSFTMATQKSQNIKNPNGEYLERENQEKKITYSNGDTLLSKSETNGNYEPFSNKSQSKSSQGKSNSKRGSQTHLNSNEVKEDQETTLSNNHTSTLRVTIPEANKISEGQGRTYIAYTIVCGNNSVRRRYSDFESLRNLLTRLFPMVLIPPIPEKQSLKNYGKAITTSSTNYLLSTDISGSLELSLSKLNNTTSSSDEKFIRHRTIMLTKFLNRLLSNEDIMKTTIMTEFLNPNTPNWNDFSTSSPTFSNLPKSVLQCNPLDPTNTTRLHASLPIPSSSSQIQYPKEESDSKDSKNSDRQKSHDRSSQIPDVVNSFQTIERDYKLYEMLTSNEYKYYKRIMKNVSDKTNDYKDISNDLLIFSKKELQQLDLAEQFLYISSVYDESATISDSLVTKFNTTIIEQLSEIVHMAGSVKELIKFQKLKFIQKEMIRKTLRSKRNQLRKLQKEKNEFSSTDKLIEEEMAKSNQISFERPKENEHNEPTTYSGRFFKGFNKLATIVKDSVAYQDIDPDLLMESLKKEIKELQETLQLAESDLTIISNEIKERQLVIFSQLREEEMNLIMKRYAKLMKEHAEKNLKLWRDLKNNQEER